MKKSTNCQYKEPSFYASIVREQNSAQPRYKDEPGAPSAEMRGAKRNTQVGVKPA